MPVERGHGQAEVGISEPALPQVARADRLAPAGEHPSLEPDRIGDGPDRQLVAETARGEVAPGEGRPGSTADGPCRRSLADHFRRWFRGHEAGTRPEARAEVVLLDDCFTTYNAARGRPIAAVNGSSKRRGSAVDPGRPGMLRPSGPSRRACSRWLATWPRRTSAKLDRRSPQPGRADRRDASRVAPLMLLDDDISDFRLGGDAGDRGLEDEPDARLIPGRSRRVVPELPLSPRVGSACCSTAIASKRR